MDKRTVVSLLLAFVFFLTVTQPSKASVIRRMSVAEMTEIADVILHGDVTSSVGEWNEDHTQIHTLVNVAVSELIKGEVPGGVLTFRILGGTVGDTTLYIVDAPEFQQDEEVILFMKRGLLPVVGMSQGKLLIETEPGTGRKLLKDRGIDTGEFIEGIRRIMRHGTEHENGGALNLESPIDGPLSPVSFKLFAPNPGHAGFWLRVSDPWDPSPFIHWDLRELPNCKVPWSITDNTPDVDRDGLRGAADPAEQIQVFNAAFASFQAWEDVEPAVIRHVPGDRFGAVAGLRAISLDGYNLLDWSDGAVEDDIQVATVPNPVGPDGVVVAPGANGTLQTQARGDDQFSACIVDGGNIIANTAAAGDDIQVVAVGGAVAAGGVIILPGPNGTIDSAPAGDDVTSTCIVDGGNGHAETTANNQLMNDDHGHIAVTGIFFKNSSGIIIESDVSYVEDDDVQVVPLGGACAPGAVVIRPGPNGILTSYTVGGDDLFAWDGPQLVVADGGNGTCETAAFRWSTADPPPAGGCDIQTITTHEIGHFIGLAHSDPPDIMNPDPPDLGTTRRVLQPDDKRAANFLYTPDLGDAPDELGYPTIVHNGPGRELSGVPLVKPDDGAQHIFGTKERWEPFDTYVYEVLGINVSPECTPRHTDTKDDGVKLRVVGGNLEIWVAVKSLRDAEGNAHDYVTRKLYLNIWVDWNADGDWDDGGEHVVGAAAGTFVVPIDSAPDTWTDTFVEPIPPNAAPYWWVRARLDWGEDCGAILNINGDLAQVRYAAQFGEVEDHIASPTAIDLSYFTATGYEGYVEVEWTTATEFDNAGFNLHRSESKEGERLMLNSELIAAQADELGGATYSYIDKNVTEGVTYYYWLEDVDLDGRATMHGPVWAEMASVVEKPAEFYLTQNHPNPFKARTEIKYGLPVESAVTLTIYDVEGRTVRTVVTERQTAGHKSAYWDGRNDEGIKVSDGIYFYRLSTASYTEIRKMMLLK